MEMNCISEFVAQEISTRGYSLRQFSQNSGVSYQTLHQFVKGRKGTTLSVFNKILDALDINLVDLLELQQTKKCHFSSVFLEVFTVLNDKEKKVLLTSITKIVKDRLNGTEQYKRLKKAKVSL